MKQNKKLKTKFFRLFWVLYSMGKQVYKFKPTKKWSIYNVFYILLQKQDITKKEQVEKILKLNVSKKIVKNVQWKHFKIVWFM